MKFNQLKVAKLKLMSSAITEQRVVKVFVVRKAFTTRSRYTTSNLSIAEVFDD